VRPLYIHLAVREYGLDFVDVCGQKCIDRLHGWYAGYGEQAVVCHSGMLIVCVRLCLQVWA
jgi:hypothetical protein